jgi:hypothetical protein
MSGELFVANLCRMVFALSYSMVQLLQAGFLGSQASCLGA